MNAHFLKEPAVQHGHHATAAIVFTGPRRLLEAAGGCRTCRFIFQLFKFGDNPVPQGFKPEAGRVFLSFNTGHCGGFHKAQETGKPAVWRKASPVTMAQARLTLRERSPGFIGIRMRASTVSWTSRGTPALSCPTRMISVPVNPN